jgi:translocation and assembly module TamA
MYFGGICIFFFVLVFNVNLAQSASHVDIVVNGLTGDELDNVNAALSVPDSIIQDGEVNLTWLHRFERQANEKIKSALEPFGYYDPEARITLETVEQDTYRLHIKVTLGEPVRITEVHIRVNGPGSDEAALKALVASFPLKEGDVLLHPQYEQAKGELKGQALNLGYLDADFPVHKILLSQKKLSASIELVLETGPQYYFGEVHFEGAGLYPLRFLDRYLSFHTGDTFSSRELGETQLNLLNSERFSEVIVNADKTKAEGQHVPVVIKLTPSPSKHLRTGIGYGTDMGARVSLRYTDLNILHRGNELRAEANISQLLQGIGVSYIIPSLEDRDSFKSLELQFVSEDVDTYETKLLSLGANMTKSFGKGRLGTAYIKIQREKSSIASDEVDSFLLFPGIRFTKRHYDSVVRPTQGYRYSADIKVSSEYWGSDTSFIQLILDANTVVPLPWRLSVFASIKGGFTVLDGSIHELPASLRFFAGGDRSIRGYKYQSLGPEDENEQVIGGKHILVGNIELERALFEKWGIAAFYDIGNAFNSFSQIDFFQGAGIGVRYYSPIGSLRLDFARQIGVDDPKFRIHFTVGLEL